MCNVSILKIVTLLCIYCSYEDHSEEKTEGEDKEKEKEKEKDKTSKKEK